MGGMTFGTKYGFGLNANMRVSDVIQGFGKANEKFWLEKVTPALMDAAEYAGINVSNTTGVKPLESPAPSVPTGMKDPNGIKISSLGVSSTTSGIMANSTKITSTGTAGASTSDTLLQAINANLSSGSKVVLLTDNGKILSDAVFYMIQDAQKNGTLPKFQ
jgi:hypothetical protein